MRKSKALLIHKQPLNAFTLIEVLLYLALFGIIFLTIIRFTLNIEKSYRDANTNLTNTDNSTYLYYHLNATLNKAVAVDEVNSVFDLPNGTLKLNLSNGESATYSKEGNVLKFNGDPLFNVDSFSIKAYRDKANVLKGIFIDFTLDGKTKSLFFNR